MADPYGIEVERRRREFTAYHGVPDFVFRPVDVPKGRGQREVGDFLLWVGRAVAIVSHKARLPSAAERETDQRRRLWLDARVAEAFDQIKGVANNLRCIDPGTLALESERGVRVGWDPTRIDGYVGVVLLDALEPEQQYAPPVMADGVPTIAMLASDWDLLHGLLPSTASMINYVARRQRLVPRCPVGSELDVFALLLEEEHTGQIEIPASGLPRNHFERVRAEHPEWFPNTRPDDWLAFVVDAMIEGAADADPVLSSAADPTEYLQITEFLDRIPLLDRVALGRAVVERCQRAGRERARVSSSMCVPHGLFVVVTDGFDRTERALWLQCLTFARHSQALDAGAPPSIMTLGVATQPIPSGNGRSHDFFFIRGGVRSDAKFRADRDERFGVVDMTPFVERWNSSDGR